MRQRTRLAQAIAHEPSLLILDEPFSGLDPIARHSMNDLLLSWVDEGRSLIVASHVLHEIESLTRSFLLLSGGRLLASGSADHIQELLFDVPSEITIQVDNARQLAAKLMTNGVADAITLTADDTLIVVTRQAIQLSTFLAESAIEKRFVVREIRSADDSLQDVFNQLMKIHRGEQ
jgi:ABC-2 type transport system ATP-binding protein